MIAHHFSICVEYLHFIANASALPEVLKGTFLMNNDCRRFVLNFAVSRPEVVVHLPHHSKVAGATAGSRKR